MFLIIGAVLAVALLSGTVGWVIGRVPAAPSEAAGAVAADDPSVTVAPVERRDLARTTTLTGIVMPKSTVTVVSRVPGRVEWLVGDVGTYVAAGEPVARLDDGDLRLQLKQAEAMLAQAQATLDRVRAGASEEELAQAEASVAQAEAAFRLAEESFTRAEYLWAQGVIAKDAYDSAKSQYDMANSQLEAARQMLAKVQRGASPEEVRAVEAQVAQAEAAVELARRQLADAVITAPVAGTVAVRHTEVGAMLGTGSPVVTLVDIDTVVVQVGVSDRLVNAVHAGDAVRVEVAALPGEVFTGEVISVSPVVDEQTRLYPVRIRVANPEHRLKPGMMATVEVTTERAEGVTAVPESAVVYKDRVPYIFIVRSDGTVQQRAVTLGLAAGGWIAVSPAEPGELVATTRQAFLADGVRVRVEREDG